ncbi:MAG: PSD1 domain-containing protein [Verrucomicrobia bacterium]|nr:PSD1 domain-containing protein [Verrucomicrobiota bacterium]
MFSTVRFAAFAIVFVLHVDAADSPAGHDFFENKIRPLLIEHCLKCHDGAATEKPKGGLALDTRAGWTKGGENGPAIVPGQPDKSLFIRAIRHTDKDLQMPPKEKRLTPQQIALFEEWVRMGAPDPRTGKPSGPPLSDPNVVKNHWAFQPVREPQVPALPGEVIGKKVISNQSTKPKAAPTAPSLITNHSSPIDAFVLAKLAPKGWTLSPPADKRTLIRRACFDLHGLPPSMAEVEAFVADKSPDAFAKLVDKLLASPRYGERWGRHWLDVARYADTKGYLAGDEQRRFAFSYTYRDYVIRSFNEDTPYDRFLMEQVAADQLQLGEDKRPLAGLGFLTLGRRFLNNVNDIIDDRIDVVTRGTMGLTVQCGRCHDHKYDPVSTAEYYSLHGIFASSQEPAEKPLLGIKPDPGAHAAYLAEKKKHEDDLEKYRVEQLDKQLGMLRKRTADYLLAADEVSPQVARASATAQRRDRDKYFQERKLVPAVVRRWQDFLAKSSNAQTPDPVWSLWHAYAKLPDATFDSGAPHATRSTQHASPLVAAAFANPPKSMKEVAERYGKLLTDADAAAPHADKEKEALRLALRAADAPPNLPAPENDTLLEDARPRLRQLKAKVDEVDATHPGAPPRAMALVDRDPPTRPYIFVRGNPANRGPEVERGFPKVASLGQPVIFPAKSSGRLELARAIASKDNPLTARVLVNRVWGWHFGQGLVRTPSDFGVRSDPPSHPELLDWLATRFVAAGWSIKQLHKVILLSATYQQASDDRAECVKADPANTLLWKFNRQRLDFEQLRDSLLLASGKLDLTPGGLPVDLTAQPFATRRTAYGYIDRQNLPAMFRTFDFASPDVSASQRFQTTVPQQALFLMNAPFVLQQAQALATRDDFKKFTTDDARIGFLYETIFQRRPAAEEVAMARTFLTAPGEGAAESAPKAGWHYGYGEFDEAAKRVKSFTPFAFFTGGQWQVGRDFPDKEFGHLLLRAEGGHPGQNQSRAVIRRWVAPRDGTVAVSGTLSHANPQGDGVQGRVVSSRAGVVAEAVAQNGSAELRATDLAVKAGGIVDFIADCRANSNSDSFEWAPKLKFTDLARRSKQSPPGYEAEWDAKVDFAKPRAEAPKNLTAWEKLAHILLVSNEAAFMD